MGYTVLWEWALELGVVSSTPGRGTPLQDLGGSFVGTSPGTQLKSPRGRGTGGMVVPEEEAGEAIDQKAEARPRSPNARGTALQRSPTAACDQTQSGPAPLPPGSSLWQRRWRGLGGRCGGLAAWLPRHRPGPTPYPSRGLGIPASPGVPAGHALGLPKPETSKRQKPVLRKKKKKIHIVLYKASTGLHCDKPQLQGHSTILYSDTALYCTVLYCTILYCRRAYLVRQA